MASITADLVRRVLLSGRAGERFLNENAVQMDVWTAYAMDPTAALELLLTPYDSTQAATLASTIHGDWRRAVSGERIDTTTERLRAAAGAGFYFAPRPAPISPRITPLERLVAARFDFIDFLTIILPKTGFDLPAALEGLFSLVVASDGVTVSELLDLAPPSRPAALDRLPRRGSHLSPDLRVALLVTLILVATTIEGRGNMLEAPGIGDAAVPFEAILSAARTMVVDQLIWRVETDRTVEPTMISVETIKADAARRVFEMSCADLTWAVIDSGIDGSHPAFHDHAAGEQQIRIDRAYDFSQLRDIVSYDGLLDPNQQVALSALIQTKLRVPAEAADLWLARLREDAEDGRPFDWETLAKLLEVAPDKPPLDAAGQPIGHGTHVAGVLAGDWRDGDNGQRVVYRGVCPDIRLYDLRVLGGSERSSEFAVVAALEFVRWLNGRNRYISIHGVNLSIGLRHQLEQNACGRTPVCLACEATVDSGVVVVAAAGNWGAEEHTTHDGFKYPGYAMISIADPGNAESVITVGSTHRERPHEYGVSFFSSRGPTGDGRAKPDVVAPGERIDGPLPNLGLGRLDGTSMAAPHVSGVAALLMARNPEMIGKPRRIKQVIVSTATDLGRVRDFQGAGLVDALRALQAV